MQTKTYILYAIIYTALMWMIVFSVHNGDFTLHILKQEITFSVATWVSMPIGIFALLSVLHMIYHGMRSFFDARALKSDTNLYASLAKEGFLGLESNKEFKTKLFDDAAEVTRSLNPWLKANDARFSDEDLALAYDAFKKVKNGEIAELRRFRLLKNNPLYIQNEKNKIANDHKYAINVLNDSKDLDEGLQKVAIKALIQSGTYEQINKFVNEFSFDDIKTLTTRHADKDLALKGDELFNILNKKELSSDEYLALAKILKKKIAPDSLIMIFRELKGNHQAAMESYLYILYDLQMIDDLRSALLASEVDEYPRIEALLFLREHGKMAKADFIYNL